MSFTNIDVHSEFFTPQEFPVEILEIAKKYDVVTCCLNPPAKQFLACMLFKEFYFMHNGISVFIQDQPPKTLARLDDELTSAAEVIQVEDDDEQCTPGPTAPEGPPQCHIPLETLSNIPTIRFNDLEDESCQDQEREAEMLKKLPVPCVIVCSRKRFLQLAQGKGCGDEKILDKLTLVVCDDVHEALRNENVKSQLLEILTLIRLCNNRRKEGQITTLPIRLVFLTVSLLHFYGNESEGFWRMKETFKKLEKLCEAKVDTSSDIVALLRYCTAAKERVVPYSPSSLPEVPLELTIHVKSVLSVLKRFLETHSFDPMAAFGYDPNCVESTTPDHEEHETDSIAEELKKIINPTTEPLQVIRQFESVLDKFGPWCAERSLILLIRLVDRLKVRTPYERHYLLLGALHTQFVRLQAKFKQAFRGLEPLDVLERYSTSKLRAVLQILRRFDLTRPIEPFRPKRIIVDEDDDDDKDGDDDVESFKPQVVQPVKSNRGRRRKNFRWNPAKKDAGRGGRNIKDTDATAETDTPIQEQANHGDEAIVVDSPVVEILPTGTELGNGDAEHLKLNNSEKQLENGTMEENLADASMKEENEVKDESEDKQLDPQKQRRQRRYNRKSKLANRSNEPPLCGILFVENRFDARMLFHYLKEAAKLDPTLIGLNPTLAISSNPDYVKDSHEAEMEHKKREDNLRKFRYREANLLIGTSIVEDGIELPKANLVIRFDSSKSFRSYLYSKGRAQGYEAEFYVFTEEENLSYCLKQLATYKLVEEILLAHSVIPRINTIKTSQEQEWDSIFPQFLGAGLSNSIAIVNRYCARLPSDTFTRLVPLWFIEVSDTESGMMRFSCVLRLPINSPVKWPITGVPMPTEVLAKQAVALQTVVVLHTNGELDDNLLPIGKEGVIQQPDLCVLDEQMEEEFGEFRPGSTKRRQYYDKQLATELIHCLPKVEKPIYLYWLRMVLTCPLPDEQNTRGRKLHPPELAAQTFGILLSKEIPFVPPFPIYTRCGEVQVQLIRILNVDTKIFTPENLEKVSAFHHYTFTSVLRLDKYLTLFDPESSENSYYVFPLKTGGFERQPEGIVDLASCTVEVDWDFIEEIWKGRNTTKPSPKNDEERKDYVFRKEDYEDAVVMPWYRSHDVPQYFYVAEICRNLTPRSQFPGCEFKTFDEYYQKKYSINIQSVNQPLLDVDHTSARLNFLTPRYVNRKGMALPTSSESTKKAKRENLEQKQILVPELCAIHPFTASLWRQAVSLPCILYRLNCILLSNNIRLTVATEIHGLGLLTLPKGFKWEPLSFGWSLSDVIAMSVSNPLEIIKEDNDSGLSESKCEDITDADNGETESKETEREGSKKSESIDDPGIEKEEELTGFAKAAKEPLSAGVSLAEALLMNEVHLGKSANDILSEEMKKCKPPPLEIGLWSNEMAASVEPPEAEADEDEDELLDPNIAFPSNLMMLDKNWTWGGRSRLFNHRVHRALYGSPTHWGEVWDKDAFIPVEDLDDPAGSHAFDNDNASVTSDMSGSDGSFLDEENSLKIQFHNGNTAEALDKRKFGFEHRQEERWAANEDLWWQMDGDDDFDNSLHTNDESGCNGHAEQQSLQNITDREDRLRMDFESMVDERISEIKDIVPWESITTIPARSQRNAGPNEKQEAKVDPYYEAMFKDMTPLEAPSSFPESEGYMRKFNDSIIEIPKPVSFDNQPELNSHVGPSPCLILQALTMSNANDGLNLERLETIGDSYLKYAITSYLFCTYEHIHEGKLSHLRSKQVSNVHLYRLGRRRGLGKVMVAAKFEPHDNWLPPGYHVPKDLDKALIHSKLPPSHVSMAQVAALKGMSASEMETALKNHSVKSESEFIPYNLVTQQSIPDKSIADCVEALIGAYLTSTGPQGALLFMSWLGMRVLPSETITNEELQKRLTSRAEKSDRASIFYMNMPDAANVILFDKLKPPKSPLLRYSKDCEHQLEVLLKGYDGFEKSIGYYFRDRSYLLQAFTHASYSSNILTDCYQRLEFLGDAILDYLITRHLYEDPRQHSPGSLTDLRSALVNNTIFASLAVKNGFHRYFRHSSPGLAGVLQKFVAFQEQHGNTLTQEYYLMDEEECEEAEDIEVPKALGDVFESVAGAIFLDSGMSLDAVWNVYFRIMKSEIDAFSKNVPKSPIRELLELEPETAKFGKPEKLWDGRRVRVTVEIFGIGVFRGIGRNYRIAKCTAAKCALRHVKKLRLGQGKR